MKPSVGGPLERIQFKMATTSSDLRKHKSLQFTSSLKMYKILFTNIQLKYGMIVAESHSSNIIHKIETFKIIY